MIVQLALFISNFYLIFRTLFKLSRVWIKAAWCKILVISNVALETFKWLINARYFFQPVIFYNLLWVYNSCKTTDRYITITMCLGIAKHPYRKWDKNDNLICKVYIHIIKKESRILYLVAMTPEQTAFVSFTIQNLTCVDQIVSSLEHLEFLITL